MGEVISKKAARDKIIDDVKATVTHAAPRAAEPDGASWAAAQARLGNIVALCDSIAAKIVAANAELTPLVVRADFVDHAADDELKGISDEIWNELGRPANDPVYELLFPGGAGFYTDGDREDQPLMMELLAELLESNLHPKLAASAPTHATTIRATAGKLETATDATRKPAAKLRLYDHMLTAVARVAHVELAKLKRLWKSEGLSESDIHSVIPDRPRGYGVAPKKPTPPPTPQATTTQPTQPATTTATTA